MRKISRIISLAIITFCLMGMGEDRFFNKSDFSEAIYTFESLINQDVAPTMDECHKLWKMGDGEIDFELIDCIGNKTYPCMKSTECDWQKTPSMFFKYLRSEDSPFFIGSKKGKIKIYIYDNYVSPSEYKDNESPIFPVEAIVKSGKNTIPVEFYMVYPKAEAIDFGKISSINIDGTPLADYVDSFIASKGLDPNNMDEAVQKCAAIHNRRWP